MDFISTVKITIHAMRANKVRTGLTVLGMVIGIATIIIVFSAGEGIKGLVLGQIESFGTDIIETEGKVPSTKKGMAGDMESGAAMMQGVQVMSLTLDDLSAIDKLPNVKKSYAAIISQEPISYGNELKKAFLYGVTTNFIDIDKAKIDYGRFFTETDDKSLSQVAILGNKIKNNLFGDSYPIGKSIKINKEKFLVIGIMKERGAVMGMDFDNFVYLPLRTLQKKLLHLDNALLIVSQLNDIKLAEVTAEDIRTELRINHKITDPVKDDFRVSTMAEAMDTLGTVTGAITLLLLAIVAISLIVGGVGIMNVMYVVVTERTAEIGLRKAVGAKYSDIMQQFLFESILITISGGIIGIIMGIMVSALVTLGAQSYGLDWKFIIPLKAYFVALGFSAIFGIIFGLYPARKAAKLDPIEALRQE